jgi:hypothetical protein
MTHDLTSQEIQLKLKNRHRQQKKVYEAIGLLKQVRYGLNLDKHDCDCCGLKLWDDEIESRINLSLQAVIGKAIKLKAMIDDDAEDLRTME